MPWMLAFALRADGWYLRQDIIWSKPNPMPESVQDRCTKSHEYIFLLSKSERYFYDGDAIREGMSAPQASTPEDLARAHSRRRETATEQRQGPVMPDHYKGSLPGRRGGPGQERRSQNDRFPKGWACGPGSHRTQDHMTNEGLTRRSGNKARKPANGAVAGSIPWEGYSRNKRSVWEVATHPFPEAHFATFPPALTEPCILAGSREGDIVLDPFFGAGTTGLVALRHNRSFVGCELNPAYVEMASRRIREDAPLYNQVDIVVL